MRYAMCLLLTGLMMWSMAAFAAAPVAGDACTTSGQVANSVNAGGALSVLWCNGSTWQNASVMVGNTVATCDATTKGAIKYDGTNAWTYCNGASFVPFNAAAGTARIVYNQSGIATNPGASSCTPPSCASGFTSQGCQWGEGNYQWSDSRLTGNAKINLINNTTNNGFVGSCALHTHSNPAPSGEYNVTICARLCIAN